MTHKLRDVRSGQQHLLEVVQDQAHLARLEVGGKCLFQACVIGAAHAEDLRQEFEDDVRLARPHQRHECDAVLEVRLDLHGQLEREPRLADAWRSDQRQQADIGAEHALA